MEIMEKNTVYNTTYTRLNESFYDILKEISEIKPQTTFTKEQEEEFLRDAIVVFEYLKYGIDIKSSEIFINNGEIPFSCLDKMIIKFSTQFWRKKSKTYSFNTYNNNEGQPVKIYEFQDNKNKELISKSIILINKKHVSMKRKILFIKSCSSTNKDSFTKSQLKNIVDYALKNELILLYDATSNKESKDTEIVKSIYEIENATKVAIEFKKFSAVDNDNINCGYLVIPENLGFPYESGIEHKFFKIKDLLKEEIKREHITRNSLKKSFFSYANI